jgi:RNA polymerase sigma factor (sigma-70 family)
LEDNDIMLAVRGGDIEKLGLLFQKHNKQLYTYFLLVTRNRTTSEDLVQEVFFRILKYRHSYCSENPFKTWMYAIAHNVRTDYFKKREKDHEYCEEPDDYESRDPGPDELLEHKNDIMMLKKAMKSLPGDQREVLILSRFNNMRYEEIGTVLGCSTGAVKVRVFRALNALTEIYCKLSGENNHGL